MIDPVELHAFAGNLERLGIDPPAEFTRARTLLTLGIDTAMANPVDPLLADFASGALTEREFPTRLRAAALEISARTARTPSCATSPPHWSGTPSGQSVTTVTG